MSSILAGGRYLSGFVIHFITFTLKPFSNLTKRIEQEWKIYLAANVGTAKRLVISPSFPVRSQQKTIAR
jgi:hypothetical protein